MISICIPIYNFDVRQLLNQLYDQISSRRIQAEIVLIDDQSDEKYKRINEPVCKKHKYIELDDNIGRAKIRNLFLQHTKFDKLLFLDCDSIIISDKFLSNYIETLDKKQHDVICGGRVYPPECPGRNKKLRWKYGTKKESQPYYIRQQSPNNAFMTNNFIIQRKILEQIKFEEKLTEYGHEDTLFGFMLKKAGIEIEHINNPVMNGDIENNKEYLQKTEMGIKNLAYILDFLKHDKDFIQDVSILDFYSKTKSKNLSVPVYVLFMLLKPLLRFFLIKGFVNLSLFDFYKLGTLTQTFKQHKYEQQSNN